MKILVRNLARTSTQENLEVLFSNIGAVQSCNIVMDQTSGLSKGFGFVEMPKVGEAKQAINKLNHHVLDGNKIRVKKAEQKPGSDTVKSSEAS
ncbi:RNA recognition motif domain-containing protein [Glaciecola petra]|uniref:RNA-binding protein n=1 Tax=Glaciecola petra TaxID=3075602 RepID=A0ABU2ZTC4_9ALTE|nr:RNA-binding protein [Aestuariibacter sp. P117]MDT0595569.1 RNA-binding protein [Aestuariibacter sp. P117]